LSRVYQDKYAGILRVAIYLRKSRADEELERELGKGETLARHRKALFRVVKDHNFCMVRVYEEVESGDSIINRPAMLELLRDIAAGLYDAVLVMDIHRLGRGDQQDQGLIIKTFKESGTKIVTLDRVFDLNDEFDEDYVENESYMGRKEYKYIKRRLQGGRVRSVEEGNYIGTRPPYGYSIRKEKHIRTLDPHPDQAEIVKMIFDLYVNKGIGIQEIANTLNATGIPSYTGIRWDRTVVSSIIKNVTYIGKVPWNRKKTTVPRTETTKRSVRTRDRSEWIVANGKHPPLIDEATFQRAQEIIRSKYHVPYQVVNGVKNPLAGIVVCGKCGYMMHRRPYKCGGPHLLCVNCDNKSSRLDYVEQKLLDMLTLQLKDLLADTKTKKAPNESANLISLRKHESHLEKEISELNGQKNKLHDLLERGVYSTETFIERSKVIADRIEEIQNYIKAARLEIAKEERLLNTQKTVIPHIQNVLNGYWKTDDPIEKNMLLKSVIEKVEYVKTKDQRDDDFSLKVFRKVLFTP
jgi:DNA invertase Pin-like site-specific DNA recombinase